MKTSALVGFTYIDAMVWLADECRERGCAMAVSAGGKKVWIGTDLFLVEPDEEAARVAVSQTPGLTLNEIITRENAA